MMLQASSSDTPVGVLCRGLPRFASQPSLSTVVFAWGVNEDSQLGLDDKINILSPKVVESFLGIRLAGRTFYRSPIVSGSRNTLAIDAAGQVWSWGWNDRGTLGLGHRMKVPKPQRLTALNGVKIVQVAVNGWHCLALSDQGQVYSWGGNEYFQCGVEPGVRDVLLPTPCVPQLKVRQVACGGMHSLVLTEDGTVWTWGEPWGDFSMNVERRPRPVPGAVGMACIAAGAFHNMALTYAGQVYTWGTNDYGQLGNGHTTYNTEPSPVADMDGIQVADIAAGGWHSLALSVEGEVYAWGRGEYGRLGIGDPSGSSKLRPYKVRALEGHRIVQVAAGGTHTLAVSSEGRLWSWGRASFGRLGLTGASGKEDQYSPVEVSLPGGSSRWYVAAIACGGRHSLCLALPLHDPLLGGSSEASESGVMSEDVEGGSEASLAYRESQSHFDHLPFHGPQDLQPVKMAGGSGQGQNGHTVAQRSPATTPTAHTASTAPQTDLPVTTSAVNDGTSAVAPQQQATLPRQATLPQQADVTAAPLAALHVSQLTLSEAALSAAGAGQPPTTQQPPPLTPLPVQLVSVAGTASDPTLPPWVGASVLQANALSDVTADTTPEIATQLPTDTDARSANYSTLSTQGSVESTAASSTATAAAAVSALTGMRAGSTGLSTAASSELGALPSIDLNVSNRAAAAPIAPDRPSLADGLGLSAATIPGAAADVPVQPSLPLPPQLNTSVSRGRQQSVGGARLSTRYPSSGLGSPRQSSAPRGPGSPTRLLNTQGSGGGGARRSRSHSPRGVGEPSGVVGDSAGAVGGDTPEALTRGVTWSARDLEDESVGEGGGSVGVTSWPDGRTADMHTLVDMSLEDEDFTEQKRVAAKARRRAARQDASRSRNPSLDSGRGGEGSLGREADILEGDSESPMSDDEPNEDYEEDGGVGSVSAASRISYHTGTLIESELPGITAGRSVTRPMSPNHAYATIARVKSSTLGSGLSPGNPVAAGHLQGTLAGTLSPLRVAGSPAEQIANDVAARLAAAVVGSPRNSSIPPALSFNDMLAAGVSAIQRSASPLPGTAPAYRAASTPTTTSPPPGYAVFQGSPSRRLSEGPAGTLSHTSSGGVPAPLSQSPPLPTTSQPQTAWHVGTPIGSFEREPLSAQTVLVSGDAIYTMDVPLSQQQQHQQHQMFGSVLLMTTGGSGKGNSPRASGRRRGGPGSYPSTPVRQAQAAMNSEFATAAGQAAQLWAAGDATGLGPAEGAPVSVTSVTRVPEEEGRGAEDDEVHDALMASLGPPLAT